MNPGMRRLVDRWWLVGAVLLVAVVVLSCVLYAREVRQHRQQQRAAQHQAVSVLGESLDDALARELALARVVGTLPGPVRPRWPVLSNIVMSQPVVYGAAFIEPVSQRDRVAFERRTGLTLVESPKLGVLRAAGPRSLHLVLSAYRQVAPAPPPLGLDLAANALRRTLLLKAARTGRQIASPPIEFLGLRRPTRGVVVYAAVRDQRGRLKGWVSASYEAEQLAATVTAHLPGVHLTILDGANILVSAPRAPTGSPAMIAVAGRRWSVWAAVPGSGISAVPWLVLSLGLALVAAVMLILRQAAARMRDSTQELALRDAEHAALGEIATLVAQGATPYAVFALVAEQIGNLFDCSTGAVSRFDASTNEGTILGGWTRDGKQIAGTVYALDGVTASAEVFRTGLPARKHSGYESSTDPVSSLMSELGAQDGVAAPIIVADELWGALGAAYREQPVPVGVEVRLERFASLVGLAISNADAWDRLARQAWSDPLTGIANRRVFHDRLGAELARAQRYGRDLSLVLLDLDHFKAINDRHGHQAGDRVLVRFAELLSAHSREGELVARVGGEEFAWLMPETDRLGAYTAAERVRQATELWSLDDVGTVSVSAGVSATEDARDAETLFHNADRALYWAKDDGRNTTFVFTADGTAPEPRSIRATASRSARHARPRAR
jgi:diguanylate cyclase (GGDEF)-like protein